ncbi:MAG: Cytidyltransferase-related domain protein [Parcubacteria group bacterium GW2011_GWA2_38_13]|nr:MAG: Cytidyltransferase-related domain protein [Parcubacteria group bacterium GW2011_GWA2_38_13]
MVNMKKVFVSGCYDIVHGGHIEFFTQAKKYGDYLIVSVANDKVLEIHKDRKSSLPVEHKVRLLKAISIIDEVVVGDGLEPGLDFKEHFLRIKPNYLVATEDDKFGEKKKKLCAEVGAQYVVIPKTLSYEKISTTEIINFIKAPKQIPLRVDFAGGWLDVPKFSRNGGYIVNCAISPLVSLSHWEYEIKSGLGGSAAYSVLMGKNAVETELNIGVGWQDPAIISETGLCVWRSGELPVLEMKINPSFLLGKMTLYWTGTTHSTPDNTNRARDYDLIYKAGIIAADAIFYKQFEKLWEAVKLSYRAQLQEGMSALPDFGEIAKKYCGGGWGGYALYIFDNVIERDKFLIQKNTKKIEPYIANNIKNNT